MNRKMKNTDNIKFALQSHLVNVITLKTKQKNLVSLLTEVYRK